MRLCYEAYGAGEPLLLIHGTGRSIADWGAQIGYFRRRYRVIAMDSRDHGRSEDSAGSLTYERMTDDLAALLEHLKTGAVNVLGWSDGGIEALLLGIGHPARVKKIAALGANLNPTEQAVYPEVLKPIQSMLAEMPAATRDTLKGRRELKVSGMSLEQPQIDPKTLHLIAAPHASARRRS